MSIKEQSIHPVSILICTYNRYDILSICLKDLLSKIAGLSNIEVVIIDNAADIALSKLINILRADFPNLVYVQEPKKGHSHARNKGAEIASSEWLVYLDDDALIRSFFMERLNYNINSGLFDCFGGTYYAKYLQPKPKWIPASFGTKILLRQDVGLIDGSTGWLSGNIFAIRKQVLRDIGGFNPKFGMIGSKTGYGDEDELQMRLLANGYKIGFDPYLKIDHLVLPFKLVFSWHLNSTFQKGMQQGMCRGGLIVFIRTFSKFIFSLFGLLIKRFPLSLFRIITRKDYYIQNFIYDCINPFYKYFGLLKGQLSKVI